MIATDSTSSCVTGFDEQFFCESFDRTWALVEFSGAWDPGSLVRSSDFEYLALVPPSSVRTDVRASRVNADGSVDETPVEPGSTAGALAGLLERGHTLICDEASARWPAIHEVCERLTGAARRFAPVAVRSHSTCGLFLTPRNAQGLALHHDSQHVFAIQLEGEKTWRLYAPPHAHAITNSDRDTYRAAKPPLLAEITLEPGDALYVPRGFPHEVATAGGAHSLHMSIGLTTLSWYDVVLPLLQGTNALRASVPSSHPEEEAKALAGALLEALSSSAIADQTQRVMLADLTRASQHGRGIVADAVAAQPAPPFVKRFADYRVVLLEGSAVVGFPGGLMRFPVQWFDRLVRFLGEDLLDDVGARVLFSPDDATLLVRTLIENRFVRSSHER